VVYAKWCAPCHDPGVTHPGTHALTVKYQGVKPGVLLEWKDLPSAAVKLWVRHGISVMPQFRKTEISDAELGALAAYLARNTPAG
jgi:mono/diheme cytochrome c family protein